MQFILWVYLGIIGLGYPIFFKESKLTNLELEPNLVPIPSTQVNFIYLKLCLKMEMNLQKL